MNRSLHTYLPRVVANEREMISDFSNYMDSFRKSWNHVTTWPATAHVHNPYPGPYQSRISHRISEAERQRRPERRQQVSVMTNSSWEGVVVCPANITDPLHSGWVYHVFGECVYNLRQYFAFFFGMSSIVFWLFAQVP